MSRQYEGNLVASILGTTAQKAPLSSWASPKKGDSQKLSVSRAKKPKKKIQACRLDRELFNELLRVSADRRCGGDPVWSQASILNAALNDFMKSDGKIPSRVVVDHSDSIGRSYAIDQDLFFWLHKRSSEAKINGEKYFSITDLIEIALRLYLSK